jgi:cell division GTPase FtsZ
MNDRIVVTDLTNTELHKTKEVIDMENAELEKLLQEQTIELEAVEKTTHQNTEDKMTTVMTGQVERSMQIGVVGVGQCGARLGEEMYKRGYKTVIINTAMQDLKLINIPEKQKLFLDFALGGAAKSLEMGNQAAEEYAEAISEMLNDNFADSTMLLLAVSGGGGSGSGSAETMVRLMSALGKPISVLFVLPLASDDSLSKSNAVTTLSKLAQLAQNDTISSLIIVDNARIESLYSGLSIAEFWGVANKAIVEPLCLFNELSAKPSAYTSLDSMDFASLFIDKADCVLYGMTEVAEYDNESSVAEAMINNVKSGLLADNFDLSQARSVGVIITGNKKTLSTVQASTLEYGFAMVGKLTSDSAKIFKGIYEVDTDNDTLKIYTFISGLGLPQARIEELRLEAERSMEALKEKESKRSTGMNVGAEKTNTGKAADDMYKKIANKNSSMSKLTKNVIDKRRR